MSKTALLTLKELCQRYSFKQRTVYQWIRQNEIPYLRAGGRVIRFSPEEIDEWLRRHRDDREDAG